MNVFNSLTRRVEELKPLEGNTIRLYTCGPTVYNFAHIGNFRAYAFEDILHRTLAYAGYEVTHVANLTDVDDKTIKGSRAAGVPLRDYTKTYKDAFFEDLKTLSIAPAAVYPAATDHVAEMIALIEKLFEKGLAYQAPDKCVYFSVAKDPEYGKLAHLDRSGMRASVRISNDEYAKDDVGDFALWKAWDEADGDVKWDSPWGPGRPGWHIECSAMSMKYLGETFDLHCGGIDNLFPHHENEIAQAECATGKPFVKTWLHCAHLRVNGEKMSKSAGNFFTLRDLLAKGYTGREIRYVLVSGQYRTPINFSFDALAAARTALARVDEFTDRMSALAAGAAAPADVPAWLAKHLESFETAIGDDLNTPLALAAVFSLVNDGNRLAQDGSLPPAEAAAALAMLAKMDTVLAVLAKPAAAIPADIQALADERAAARKAKNWAESDRLRDEIAAAGWLVKDSKDGQSCTKK